MGPLGVAPINKSNKRMHKTSQARTHNKYIGGQVRSKQTLVFSVVFGLAKVGFYVRGGVDWKNAAMHLTSSPPPALILEGPATENKTLHSPDPPTFNIKAGGGGPEC